MWTLAPLKNYDNFQKESAALQTGDTSELNMEQMSDYTNMKAFVDAKEAGTLDAEDAAQNSGAALYTVFGDPNGGYAALDQLIKRMVSFLRLIRESRQRKWQRFPRR
ncbi:MAG: hypothetical protein ACLR2E_10875 [Lachnospiraceae bacterium]